MATKKTSKRVVRRKANKSEFVRGLPREMPAAEVIERAKAEGLKLTPGYVYSVRALQKKHAAPPASRIEVPSLGELFGLDKAMLGYAAALKQKADKTPANTDFERGRLAALKEVGDGLTTICDLFGK